MKLPRFSKRDASAMTLLELLIVVTIIAILMAILVPSLGKVMEITRAAKNTVNLREIGLATINWAADNGNRLPSPEYPGGMEVPSGMSEEEYFPEYYKLGDSGLWLDGVVFGAVYLQETVRTERTENVDVDSSVGGYDVDAQGTHLKGTLFENTQSVRENPDIRDWHEHSYAMNANLQYDRIYDQVGSSDPYLTEKSMATILFKPKAMLYIENQESNVVQYEDLEAIIETGETRWGNNGKISTTFMDGHAERLHPSQIPSQDPETDRESSRFWRGVDP